MPRIIALVLTTEDDKCQTFYQCGKRYAIILHMCSCNLNKIWKYLAESVVGLLTLGIKKHVRYLYVHLQ